jgi:ribosomal protein L29
MENMNDLRKMKMKELTKKMTALDMEITNDKFEIKARKSNKTRALREKRKDLARIATVMNELSLLTTINTLEKSNETK